jgi:hypothetical protein
MLTVPLQSTPSQSLNINLDGQNAQINVYQLGVSPETSLYFDLLLNGAPIVNTRICRGYGGFPEETAGGVEVTQPPYMLTEQQYLGFSGDFLFIDTQASPTQNAQDPVYTGLGTRWQLLYLEASDFGG